MFQAVFSWATPPMDAASLAGFDASLAGRGRVLPRGTCAKLPARRRDIAGVGGVLVFLPQIVILFLFILLLEDLGYMARAAFLMDRMMGGPGCTGRAFIPLLSSFACAIPGIMAARVIAIPRDRLTTILVAPLMTCSARHSGLYAVIISAFIPARQVGGVFNLQGLVMFVLYAAGIAGALGAVVRWRSSCSGAISRRRRSCWNCRTTRCPRPDNVARGLMTVRARSSSSGPGRRSFP